MDRFENYIKKCCGRVITATKNNTVKASINKEKLTRKKNGKKNNCMDISSYKQLKLARENLDVAKKGKLEERNWISSDSDTEYLHKD